MNMEKWVLCENCDTEVCIDFYPDSMTVMECDEHIEVYDDFDCSECGHVIHLTAYFKLTGFAIGGASE
jgi:DNA-directed RNA polymerase subunit RPC12/RpoP